jgi:hypothetical protein
MATPQPRMYNLNIVYPGGSAVVPLQTAESRDWVGRYAQELSAATELQLLPVLADCHIVPAARVRLKHGQHWLYWREVTGVLIGPPQQQTVVHCLGFQDGNLKCLLRIFPDGSVDLSSEA